MEEEIPFMNDVRDPCLGRKMTVGMRNTSKSHGEVELDDDEWRHFTSTCKSLG